MTLGILNHVPEIFAGFTFFPLGLGMSFLVNFVAIISVLNSLLNILPRSLNVAYGPFCAAILCTLLTGALQTGIKIRQRKFIFEHFYLMMFGMTFCLIGGIVLAAGRIETDEVSALRNFIAGCYLIAIGIGTTYVPALSYINVRISNNNYRTIEIGCSHCWYLLGFAIGTVVQTHSYANQIINRHNIYTFITIPSQVFGYYMLGLSALVLTVYVMIELMQYFEAINYRKSEDDVFERENEKCEILDEKYFSCNENEENTRTSTTQDAVAPVNRTKYILVIVFLVCSRGKNFVLFFAPLLLINSLFSVFGNNGFHNFTPYVGYLLAFAGAVLSTILLKYLSPKVEFIISCIVKILALLCCVIPVIITGFASNETRIYIWCLYFFLGFGYSLPDIDILELVDFKWNEFILSLSFAFELLVICVVQFLTLHSLETILVDEKPNISIQVFLWIIVVFVMILPVLGIIAAIVLPNTFGKTLFRIKNEQSGYK